jgi:hypothetical protein
MSAPEIAPAPSAEKPVLDVRPEATGTTSEVLFQPKKFFSDRDSKTQVT